MRVRPVDLRGPSPQETADLGRVRAAANPPRAGVHPAPDLALPGRRTACWLAYDGPRPVGALSLVLPAASDDGFIRLDVSPPDRRRGAARQLITEAVRISWAMGREVLRSRFADDGPGVGFAQAMGGVPGPADDLVVVDPRASGLEAWIPVPAPPQETVGIIGAWAPDLVVTGDGVGLTAVGSAGEVCGVAAEDAGGSALVVLPPGGDPLLGRALAEAYAAMRGASARPVWVPRGSAPAPDARAGRTLWTLDVGILAKRIGMH